MSCTGERTWASFGVYTVPATVYPANGHPGVPRRSYASAAYYPSYW